MSEASLLLTNEVKLKETLVRDEMNNAPTFISARITPSICMQLNENEMRLLAKISAYGTSWIEKNTSLTNEEKDGLQTLWPRMRRDLESVLSKTKKARELFYKDDI